jgi:hypothetical protein
VLEVGDHVYLRVSPMKGVKTFRMKGKLMPHYIGPFIILEKCETMAYKLDLPPSLAGSRLNSSKVSSSLSSS